MRMKWIVPTILVLVGLTLIATGNVNPRDLGSGIVLAVAVTLGLLVGKAVQAWRRRGKKEV